MRFRYFRYHPRQNRLTVEWFRGRIISPLHHPEHTIIASAPTEIAKTLVAEGLVLETGFGISSGGRKPVQLTFNDEAYHVVAVDLDAGILAVGWTPSRAAWT